MFKIRDRKLIYTILKRGRKLIYTIKVTEISLHSFSHVKEVLTAHGNRIEWFLGNAIDILPKLPAEYDLATDIFGSYFYSEERVPLIKAIHGVLKS